jgi:hypothetical protein
MSKPLIQIDDLIREMTDEEHAEWLLIIDTEQADETPSAD